MQPQPQSWSHESRQRCDNGDNVAITSTKKPVPNGTLIDISGRRRGRRRRTVVVVVAAAVLPSEYKKSVQHTSLFDVCVCVIDGWPALNHPGGGSNALQFNCVLLLLLLRLPMNFVFGVFLSPNFVANHGQKKHDRGKQ